MPRLLSLDRCSVATAPCNTDLQVDGGPDHRDYLKPLPFDQEIRTMNMGSLVS